MKLYSDSNVYTLNVKKGQQENKMLVDCAFYLNTFVFDVFCFLLGDIYH